MPDEINYIKEDVIIRYIFSNTKTRYTGSGPLAGFIGALAETGLQLTTTGSCFAEGSCFSSAEHVNEKTLIPFIEMIKMNKNLLMPCINLILINKQQEKIRKNLIMQHKI